MSHFAREKIPARNVHALGTGAYGSFTVTNDISKYCKAKLFSEVGKKTNIFVRFSGIFTEQGEPDTTRDGRGFAIKFYTEEGNWDLLAINTPVFPLRDMKIGPDQIHSFKRDPRDGMWNPTTLWDFALNHPESFHQILMLYTDRGGTPMSFRAMNSWGCNTFSFINSNNERFWVKFHLLSALGSLGLTQHQAKLVAGEDPNFLTRDLRDAIARGDYPKWRLCVQIMPEEEGYRNPWAFDATKVWKHKDYPLIEIGTLQLDRNPIDYFSEVEQAAFSPARIVPGISFSPDKLLQGRLFIYGDAQHHRIGPNYQMLPVNRARCPVSNNYMLEGTMNTEIKDWFPHYSPSTAGGPKPAEKLTEPSFRCDGKADFYAPLNEGSLDDYYSQPAEFLRVIGGAQYNNLCDNIALSWLRVQDETIPPKLLEHFRKMDTKFANLIEQRYRGFKEGTLPMSEEQLLVFKLKKTMETEWSPKSV